MSELRSEVGDLLEQATLRYTTVWEDHRLLEEGLDIQPDDDVVVICSSGDNALALLLKEPRSVVAVDMNPAQTALLELKLAAIRHGTHADLAALIGVGPGDAVAIYGGLREHLPTEARAFWDSHHDVLGAGVAFAGRLERYILGFAREHLGELWGPELLGRLIAAPSVAAQAALFEAEGRTPAFVERFSWYFGREQMAANGRDPAQFSHVEQGDVGGYFLRRFTWAMTSTRLADNFYLRAFCGGGYGPLERGPEYLRPANFERLRGLAGRIRTHTGQFEQLDASPGAFSKGGFSDMFEYMGAELAAAVLEGLVSRFRPGGRLAWWCLLVPRGVPVALADRLESREELSKALWQRDRSWFYRSFHVAQVR